MGCAPGVDSDGKLGLTPSPTKPRDRDSNKRAKRRADMTGAASGPLGFRLRHICAPKIPISTQRLTGLQWAVR